MADQLGFRKTGAGQQLGVITPEPAPAPPVPAPSTTPDVTSAPKPDVKKLIEGVAQRYNVSARPEDYLYEVVRSTTSRSR